MYKKSNSGFTMIEILLVVAVLGILASIAIPRLANIQNRAHDTQIAVVADTIRNGMEAYYQEKNNYPGTIADWDELDSILDNIELEQAEKYNIDEEAFTYKKDNENYQINITSTKSSKEYLISNDDFEEVSGGE